MSSGELSYTLSYYSCFRSVFIFERSSHGIGRRRNPRALDYVRQSQVFRSLVSFPGSKMKDVIDRLHGFFSFVSLLFRSVLAGQVIEGARWDR